MATVQITPASNKLVKEYASLRGVSNDEACNLLINTGFGRLMASRRYAEAMKKTPKKAVKKATKKAAKKAATKTAKKAATKAPKKAAKKAAKKTAKRPAKKAAKKPAKRTTKLSASKVKKHVDDGLDATDIAEKYGVSEATVVKLLAAA